MTIRFRPSLASTLSLLVLSLLSFRLGLWQLDRAGQKEMRLAAFREAQTFLGLPEAGTAREFAMVILEGAFDETRHVLADNQVHKGKPGVHVYSPYQTADGKTILVNRGWLPMAADRRRLPEITTPEGTVGIRGRIGPLPATGRQLGKPVQMKPDEWPQLLTYPDVGRIATALQIPLYPDVMFLDASSPGGFEGRAWRPVVMGPDKHRAYAFQWFALAVAAVAAWILLAFRRGAGQ